jgi:hypothetical protein
LFEISRKPRLRRDFGSALGLFVVPPVGTRAVLDVAMCMKGIVTYFALYHIFFLLYVLRAPGAQVIIDQWTGPFVAV